MASHGFGIIPYTPNLGRDFSSEYAPQKYECIFVEDDYIEGLLEKLNAVPTFFHSTARPANGLAYCGITLIPPKSLEQFQQIIEKENNPVYRELVLKIKQARKENRFILHYGI